MPSWTRGTSGRRSPTRPAASLGNVTWIVDFNRQSLDRVIPGVRSGEFTNVFRRARLARRGILKYGRSCARAYDLPAATRCAAGSTTCRTPSTRACSRPARRPAALSGGRRRTAWRSRRAGARARALLRRGAARPDRQPGRPRPRRRARRARPRCDAERRAAASVIFAFTVKGWGLPIAGHPMNHSALLLDRRQIDALRLALGRPRRRVGRVRSRDARPGPSAPRRTPA